MLPLSMVEACWLHASIPWWQLEGSLNVFSLWSNVQVFLWLVLMKKINEHSLSAAIILYLFTYFLRNTVTLYLLSVVNVVLHHPIIWITLIFISINYNQLSIQDNILRSKNSYTRSLLNCLNAFSYCSFYFYTKHPTLLSGQFSDMS